MFCILFILILDKKKSKNEKKIVKKPFFGNLFCYILEKKLYKLMEKKWRVAKKKPTCILL